MAAARQTPEQAASLPAESWLPESEASGLRWRELFPGEQCQLSAVRRWVESLLPQCPARDDVMCVATELGTNAAIRRQGGAAASPSRSSGTSSASGSRSPTAEHLTAPG